ncbi:MAG: iron donor protein CyaY [Myxococcales bacterium]|nr:iron donor protein CyaY [Myxococcales bacterium]
MDEKEFRKRSGAIYKAVCDRLDLEDPDEVEAELTSDVVRIRCKGGKVFILNHQTPLSELWYAAGDRAWHFQFDPSAGKWIDPRNFEELGATLAATITRAVGKPIAFAVR